MDIWERIVARYFDAAGAMIEGEDGSGEKDARAIAAASHSRSGQLAFEERVEVLRAWIIDYSVHRVHRKVDDGEASFARAAARKALTFFDAQTSDHGASRPNIYKLFGDLRKELGDAVDNDGSRARKLLSLTSKVLWCRYPDDTPIYDDLASTALYVLVKLLKAIEEPGTYLPNVEEKKYENAAYDPYWTEGWDDANKLIADGWYYRDYAFTHSFLFDRFRPAIEIRCRSISAAHATPFRVFDKMLWLLGSDGNDYSLKGSDIASRKRLAESASASQ